ncbi:MAG TPA: VanZ family protein [Herpetosiphonaceae bacterium]
MSSGNSRGRIVDPAMRRSILALVLLAIYLVVLLTLTMAPTRRLPIQMVNLIPFKTILAGIQRGGLLFNVNVLGNIVAFVPLGVLVPALSRRLSVPAAVLAAGAFVSVSIEVLQWLFARRVADIDDVILNVVGALMGYGCALLLAKDVLVPPEDSAPK